MKHDPLPPDPLDRSRYPLDPWRLVETRPEADDVGTTETLFAVGNGYIGMRGNPEEGRPSYTNGTYINGFHETWTIRHAEEAYGFAHTGQTIVNAPDTKTIKLYVDDEPLLIGEADLEFYERVLDFRSGELRRELVWRTPAGKRVRVTSTRMVSLPERHLAVMTFEVTLLEGDASVVISSQILNREDGVDEYDVAAAGSPGFDPRKAARFDHRVLLAQLQWHDDNRMLLGYRCANSGMTLVVGADHTVESDAQVEDLISTEPDVGKRVFRLQATEGQSVSIVKTVSYHTADGVPVRELVDRCRRTLDRARANDVESYRRTQREWLDRYWDDSDVTIAGQPAIQQATRWGLFQVAQAAARAELMGIPAKGLTGSGYEGHYFWDTEIYVLPFLCYTNPQLARNALRFRWTMLPKALARAAEMSERGALFPWRTINGDEASAYYAAGTAQYHIDADIAYAFNIYSQVTGDFDFTYRYGAEVLVQTARMWADMGFWRIHPHRTSFQIHGVTGPDEYTTVVNNNLFTNVMARGNLLAAASVVQRMRVDAPALFEALARRVDLRDDEPEEWERCAQGMYIPYDEQLGLHPQDDDFLGREVWDLENTPAENFPLLLHYHPLVIYRFQVLKQADVVLAEFLHGELFTPAEKRDDFEYYDRITTGDSTLSAVVQSIVAAEIGYASMAMDYFLEGLYVDLTDLHGNTSDGVHIASAGGVWNALVHGFGGMRDYYGELTFDPRLPHGWDELSYKLQIRQNKLSVHVRQDEMELQLLSGEGMQVQVRGQRVRLQEGESVVVPLDGQGLDLPPLRGPHPAMGGLRSSDLSIITASLPAVESGPTESADQNIPPD